MLFVPTGKSAVVKRALALKPSYPPGNLVLLLKELLLPDPVKN